MNDTLELLMKRVIAFRNERDWQQFHNPKDSALSLVLESAEVLELFQWKNNQQMKEFVLQNQENIGNELSDVLYWVLLMSHDMGINLADAFERKMQKNELKYPIDKARGNSKKYTQL